MMKTKAHQNKLMKIITMPIRALAKARDFYVRSMNNYADKVCYGGAGFGSSAYGDPLPRSFSTNSVRSNDNGDDFKELVRAASTSTLGNRIDLSHSNTFASSNNNNNVLQKGKESLAGNSKLSGVPRSASVGMAKIEEDKPCEFGDFGTIGMKFDVDNDKKGNDNNKRQAMKDKFRLFPRSRSYAVGSTKRAPGLF